MIESPIIDMIFSLILLFMWLVLFYHAIMAIHGYYYFKLVTLKGSALLTCTLELPGISILIPSRNEQKVIGALLDSLLDMEYPRDRVEIIVINDGSTDNTKKILDDYASKFRRVIPLHVPRSEKSHGKSAALNKALKIAKYDYISVYDADNLVERMALQYLVRDLLCDPKLAAVCGKIRTYNRNKNLLTRFENIEFIAHQWILQAGRWKSNESALIPGTNYVIKKSILMETGGWDEQALAEDAELSLRIFSMGYKIKFFPLAVSWEQEPEEWAVWRRQRLRWIQGNKYIVKRLLLNKEWRKKNLSNFLYMFMIYYLLVAAIIISDIIFILGVLSLVQINTSAPLFFLWFFALAFFCVEIMIALTFERGEDSWTNFGVVVLMYFTYCQQWLFITLKTFIVREKESKMIEWDKTERF